MIRSPNATKWTCKIKPLLLLEHDDGKKRRAFVYESAISWILSLFFDSQITTDGKLVVQSRYDVSTTKLIAWWWNASNADIIRKNEPTHDRIIANNQNSRSTNEMLSSIKNLTPCSDEFSIYSFKIRFKWPIFRDFFSLFTQNCWYFSRSEWVSLNSFRKMDKIQLYRNNVPQTTIKPQLCKLKCSFDDNTSL